MYPRSTKNSIGASPPPKPKAAAIFWRLSLKGMIGVSLFMDATGQSFRRENCADEVPGGTVPGTYTERLD